jgi:phosphoribosylamine---glycine ligase
VLVDDGLRARIEREIVRPVLHGMAAEGMPFTGFLYCGLMLTAAGPKVIEFNCRFGDPEAQVVLPLLAEPLAPVLASAAGGGPLPATLQFSGETAVGVVVAAGGYPGTLDTGHAIDGLDRVRTECPAVEVRFAGVAAREGALVVSGGRVLTVVSRAPHYADAIAAAYDGVRRIRFHGMQYRTDIGARALAAARP